MIYVAEREVVKHTPTLSPLPIVPFWSYPLCGTGEDPIRVGHRALGTLTHRAGLPSVFSPWPKSHLVILGIVAYHGRGVVEWDRVIDPNLRDVWRQRVGVRCSKIHSVTRHMGSYGPKDIIKAIQFRGNDPKPQRSRRGLPLDSYPICMREDRSGRHPILLTDPKFAHRPHHSWW